MAATASLFEPYLDVVFLLYGLAFFSMALVIVARNDRGSAFRIAPILWLLAAFGFIHGAVEWMDFWRIAHGDTPGFAALRAGVLLVSYLFLFEFGRRLASVSLSVPSRAVRRLLGPWIYMPLLVAILAGMATADQPAAALVVWSRYVAGFTGACLAGAGCHLYARNRIGSDATDFPGLYASWNAAAFAFAVYGILGGLIVPRASGWPASVVNEDAFAALFHFPVQLPRAVCAVVIAISVGHFLRVFELERQRKLRYALDAAQYASEESLRINQRYEAILDSAAEGIVGVDTAGNVAFANEAALRMLWFERGELIGKAFHDLACHTDADGREHSTADCPILAATRDNAERRVDAARFWRKNRTWFPVAYRSAPLRRGAAADGAVVVFRDLNDGA